ncbi:MAG: tetratricopeptide repeat protein [Flavipsychrobacter sp.]|nr:tetratricopeptide repeat protein [Flavipsychrobacter sp.]
MFAFWSNSYYLIIAAQVICILHLFKTGRSREWLFLLIFLPLLGCLIYFIKEILPGLGGGSKVSSVANSFFSGGRIKELERNLRISDTDANRLKLAEEYAHAGNYERAIELTRSCLVGIYSKDPGIMRDLATYHALNGQFEESVGWFKKVLAAKNGKFDRPDDELAYAKALDGAGMVTEAEEEYRKVIRIHHSVEAMYRYGMLLKKLGRIEEANAQFQNAVDQRDLNPGYVRRTIAPWINAARKELR